jgi:hypothetical protein
MKGGYNFKMNISVVTFGDEKWSGALKRITLQLKETGLFTNIVSLDKESLEVFCKEFKLENLDMVKEKEKEGYGGYLWKPYIIEKMFYEYPESEYFIYIDSGTEINIDNDSMTRKRFLEYIEYANKFDVFCFKNRDSEKMFSHCEEIKDIFPGASESRGHHAGFIILKNSNKSLQLIKDWKKWGIKDNYKYLFQKYNYRCCDNYFRGLHDQSIFSCLLKLNGISGIDDEADWYHEGYSIFNNIWENNMYPIFFARNSTDKSIMGKCLVYNKQVKHSEKCNSFPSTSFCENIYITKIDRWH